LRGGGLEALEGGEGPVEETVGGIEAALKPMEKLVAASVDFAEQFILIVVVIVLKKFEIFAPNAGFDLTETAKQPGAGDKGVDEVALFGRGGAVMVVVFGGKLSESMGIFTAEHFGFGVDAGLESVHGRDGFAGLGARTGGALRVVTVSLDLSNGCHVAAFRLQSTGEEER
jgi:hypothetical protein